MFQSGKPACGNKHKQRPPVLSLRKDPAFCFSASTLPLHREFTTHPPGRKSQERLQSDVHLGSRSLPGPLLQFDSPQTLQRSSGCPRPKRFLPDHPALLPQPEPQSFPGLPPWPLQLIPNPVVSAISPTRVLPTRGGLSISPVGAPRLLDTQHLSSLLSILPSDHD